MPTDSSDRLSETVNYESILQAAQQLAAEGHIDLVETFAHRLAARCLADARVTRARVRIEKPLALAPHAVGAGVEITSSAGEQFVTQLRLSVTPRRAHFLGARFWAGEDPYRR